MPDITQADVGQLISYRDPKNKGKKTGVLVGLVAEIKPLAVTKNKHKITVPAKDCEQIPEEE